MTNRMKTLLSSQWLMWDKLVQNNICSVAMGIFEFKFSGNNVSSQWLKFSFQCLFWDKLVQNPVCSVADRRQVSGEQLADVAMITFILY